MYRILLLQRFSFTYDVIDLIMFIQLWFLVIPSTQCCMMFILSYEFPFHSQYQANSKVSRLTS